MEYPKRKPNRLTNYDYSHPGAYFITVCTNDRAKILGRVCVGDGVLDVPQMQLTKLGQVIENRIAEINRIYSHLTIDKYVIMPNHIHMIVFITGENGTSRTPSPTNKTIPRLLSTFKRFVNRECGMNIFQRSYHDHVIRNEADYLRIWNYIDTNPATWEQDCFYTEE